MNTQPIESSRSIDLLDPQALATAKDAAMVLMRSSLVPLQFQAGPDKDKNHIALGNTLIALNMARRMGADPLMVMQNLYVVHGRPSWSSQFLIACFNSCGRFSALQYKFSGEPGTDDYGCYAWALEYSTQQRIEGTKITIGMAKKEKWFDKAGSKWQTMPDQMLRYRAATFFIRTTAPEIAMGLQTQDEVEDMRDVTPTSDENKSEQKKYAYTKVKGTKKTVIDGTTETDPMSTIPVESVNQQIELVNKETGEVSQLKITEPTQGAWL